MLVVAAGLAVAATGIGVWRGRGLEPALTASVRRGDITSILTLTGSLSPAGSISYRSPLGGRETEVTFLAPEGIRVNEGDLVARLDTTEVERELQRTTQELRQAQVDLQVAEIEVQEARATIVSLESGEGALSIEEARTRLELAKRKVARLREEHRQLEPLLAKGFITREELRRTADELEQAEEELSLASRRADVLVGQTRPRDEQRAELQLAQREAQRENVRARLQEIAARSRLLQEQLEACSMYARRPGMVVYEDYLNASPRRKVRVGDRVTGSQVLVTIPDIDRMVVEASASEADVHRLAEGQPAAIRLEAFPDVRLAGRVIRIGTLARSDERPRDDKRFDVSIEVDRGGVELRPEMTARVDVATGHRSGVLLVPVNAVFDGPEGAVSYVVTRLGFETRSLRLGQANDTEVEVAAGLREGERVALIDPASGQPPTPGARPGAPLRASPGNRFAPR